MRRDPGTAQRLEADQRTREVEEGLVQLLPTLVADRQAAVVIQPGEGALNGSIIDDKFCSSPAAQLRLSWHRCPFQHGMELRHLAAAACKWVTRSVGLGANNAPRATVRSRMSPSRMNSVVTMARSSTKPPPRCHTVARSWLLGWPPVASRSAKMMPQFHTVLKGTARHNPACYQWLPGMLLPTPCPMVIAPLRTQLLCCGGALDRTGRARDRRDDAALVRSCP